MTIDNDVREISLFEAIEHVLAWRWLFLSFTIIAVAAMTIDYGVAAPTYKIDVAVSVYPAIPGSTANAVLAEIGERLARDYPRTILRDDGFRLPARGHAAAVETIDAVHSALDDYEVALKKRITIAHKRLLADFAKAPSNAAIYENLAQYNRFADEEGHIDLILHRETIANRRSPIWLALIFAAVVGVIIAAFFSCTIIGINHWREQHK